MKDIGVLKIKDGTEIFYEDWGTGQPIVFHHGWPLSSDDWDTQMLFFLDKVTASSLTTVVDSDAQPKPPPETTWNLMSGTAWLRPMSRRH
jgi:pimeloyl-ACP methyl ester carboxylesterase